MYLLEIIELFLNLTFEHVHKGPHLHMHRLAILALLAYFNVSKN